MSKQLTIQPAMTFRADVGAWEGVPMEVYHAADGESNSGLKLLGESPARYKMQREGKLPRRESKDFLLGSIIHGFISGDAPLYYVKPETYAGGAKKWNGNATECRDWLATHTDRPVIESKDLAMLASVRGAMERNDKLQKLLKGARYEVSACGRSGDMETPFLLRARFDVLGQDEAGWYWVDPKSMQDASTEAMQREIIKRGYHVQMALYRRVLKSLTGEAGRCYIVGVEKSRDHARVNVRQLSVAAMDEGDKILTERLKLLKRCRLTNTWPDFADDEGGEAIQFIDLPGWCYGDVDDLTGMTETESTEGESSE